MQPSTMLPKLTDTTQTISFSEGDDETTGEVYASDVVVTTSAGSHSHGSSKVKLKSLVDYNWEPKLYTGQLLAVHLSGKYLAYCIKAPNALNPGTWCGMVRVVYNPEPGTDRRALIKGMKGEVQDLAFAHITNQVVLACIDEQGNFYVHEIEVTDSGLRCTLISEVRAEPGAVASMHRVVWCPYIPDDEDDSADDDVARLLLTTHGSVARMWNMSALAAAKTAAAGAEGVRGAGFSGALCRHSHEAAIVDAAFSPDGTALATAAADGYVMFFQVYMHVEGSPRCLHKWQPHAGQPLSCLFFLDNHKSFNTDVQFWKFAVTGAENNTVIKIWSCKSWNCLQTITFTPGPGAEPTPLGLKAMLDTSASYLLLSDFKARSLYVLNMARDKDDTMAYCKSISEFLLPYPVLSFCIIDADTEPVKCESSCDDPFHRNGGDDAEHSPDDFDRDVAGLQDASHGCGGPLSYAVRLRLYIVQPKGLQEGELIYAPPPPTNVPATPGAIADGEGTADLLHGLSSLALESGSPTPLDTLQQQTAQLQSLLMRGRDPPAAAAPLAPLVPAAPPLNLMTPDAFSSPGKREDDDPPLSSTPDLNKTRTSNAGVAGPVSPPPGPARAASGGSSPSREVRDIMAHEDSAYYNHRMEDEEEDSPPREEDAAPNGELYPAADPVPTAPALPAINNSNDTLWPLISLAQISEANQRNAHPPAPAHPAPAPAPAPAAPAPAPAPAPASDRPPNDEVRASGLSAADRTRLEILERKLDKLCDLVSAQGTEVRRLAGAVGAAGAAGGANGALDDALAAHARHTATALQAALDDGWERITRVGEAATARAAAAAGAGAARALEPLAAALRREFAAKVAQADEQLQKNIERMANSKTVMERLSTSIAQSLSEMVRESLRAAILDSVVPAVERAHAGMFRQLNHAFQQGTKEFLSHTESCARAAAERGGALAVAGLAAAVERHGAALAHQQPSPHQLTQAMQEVTHNVLEKEMAWWREQARSVAAQMSRAHSPAPSASTAQDRQMQVAQIQSLMGGGDVNGAFQLALSAADLSLVVAACRGAEPKRVFGPPCLLRQHVLLSLVQQLAADMTRDTQLKHRYLEEAVMNLDTTNPVTREHLPVVIRELQKQILAFINANPSHNLNRQFNLLLMATDSLLTAKV